MFAELGPIDSMHWAVILRQNILLDLGNRVVKTLFC